MGVRATNQHLTVFVSTSAAAFADAVPNTPDDLLDDGVFLPGEITYQANDGTNFATVAAALAATGGNGTTFSIVYKAIDGEIYRRGPIIASDVFEPFTQKNYDAPVQQIDTLAIAASVTVGDEYILRLAVPNYAGMISQQDEVYFYANHVAVTGDTADIVAASLRASMKKVMDGLPVPFAAVTGATDEIIVTGIAQPYVRAKFDGKQPNFHLTLAEPEDLRADRTAHTVPYVGFGTYNQVAGMEEMYAGYNSDYVNRDADFPGNGAPTLAAAVGKTYNSSVFTVWNRHDAVSVSGRQRVTIACYFEQV